MNRACQTRILKRGGIALSAFHFMRNLGRFDTADPIGNSGERMAVELSASKTGAELLLLLRFAIGEGGRRTRGFVGNKAGGKHPRLQ